MPADPSLLRAIPLFIGMDDDERAAIAAIMDEQQFRPGQVIFGAEQIGGTLYIVQSGAIDMTIGDTVVESIGPNEALGFMSMVDDNPRSSTAKAREACELSLIDARTFRFMVDEVPNFAAYIMSAMAKRIRGMGNKM